MQINYDTEVDAKYITFKKGRVVKTESAEEWLNFDLGDDGSVIGMEILEASRHNIGVSSLGGEFLAYFEVPIASDVRQEQKIPTLEVTKEKISYTAPAPADSV